MSIPIPIIGLCAYSGTGKTTLLKQVIPLLKAESLNITVIKHAHHNFEIDNPGKDSYELRKSGADQTIICSNTRMAVVSEFSDSAEEPSLEKIVASLDPDEVDIILVEGYKNFRFPKIELHRESLGKPYMHLIDDTIIAIACDAALPHSTNIPVLDINNFESIARFIYQDFYLTK